MKVLISMILMMKILMVERLKLSNFDPVLQRHSFSRKIQANEDQLRLKHTRKLK